MRRSTPKGAGQPSVLGRFFDKLDCVAEGLNVFSRIIGDLDAELFFERHDQFNRVEAVCAQIVDERSVLNNFVSSTPKCSTTIFLTRSATSLIFCPHSFGLQRPLLFPFKTVTGLSGSCPEGRLWSLLSQGKGSNQASLSWNLRFL